MAKISGLTTTVTIAGNAIHLGKISHLWNQGSEVRSRLLELCESAFTKDPNLASIKGYVEDSGEGRWTVMEAVERGVAATALAHSLSYQSRIREAKSSGFAETTPVSPKASCSPTTRFR